MMKDFRLSENDLRVEQGVSMMQTCVFVTVRVVSPLLKLTVKEL